MTNPKNLQTALEAGAVDFIRKPIDEIELVAGTKSIINFTDLIKAFEHKKIELLKQQQEILKNQLNENNKKLISLSITQTKSEQEMHAIAIFFTAVTEDLSCTG